jgi:hypothetical protein
MSSPRHTNKPAIQAHSLSGMTGTGVMVSPANGGSPAVTLGDQWLGSLEVTHEACNATTFSDIGRGLQGDH